MISNLNSSNSRFLYSLNSIEKRLNTAQQQLSSGKRINVAADSPDDVLPLLSSRAQMESAKQINTNLDRTQTEVNAAEKALQQASNGFERARVLGSQGGSDLQDAQSRQTLAREVEAVMEQMVALARTTVEGRYIFSGDGDHLIPYTIDLSQNDPYSAYAGATTNTREVQHPNGSRFQIAKTADEIFDSTDPNSNVFDSLAQLRSALLANDGDAIRAANERLNEVAPHLERMLAYYGTVQNRVAAGVEYGKKLVLDIQTQIAAVESADLSAAILEQQQAQVNLSAALQSRAQLDRRSLFDYLR
ncbi:flagellar hook-associated protein FlgL [Bryobacterales bacterium F-183]|nr:flagellar hook-associated protein FlgL [Bryobacterales bacterium F-183]